MIVQVERVTTQHVLPLRDVHIPGIFVDGVVVAGQTAEMDDQQPCQRQLGSVQLLRIAEVSGHRVEHDQTSHLERRQKSSRRRRPLLLPNR